MYFCIPFFSENSEKKDTYFVRSILHVTIYTRRASFIFIVFSLLLEQSKRVSFWFAVFFERTKQKSIFSGYLSFSKKN